VGEKGTHWSHNAEQDSKWSQAYHQKDHSSAQALQCLCTRWWL